MASAMRHSVKMESSSDESNTATTPIDLGMEPDLYLKIEVELKQKEKEVADLKIKLVAERKRRLAVETAKKKRKYDDYVGKPSTNGLLSTRTQGFVSSLEHATSTFLPAIISKYKDMHRSLVTIMAARQHLPFDAFTDEELDALKELGSNLTIEKAMLSTFTSNLENRKTSLCTRLHSMATKVKKMQGDA